MKIRSAVVVLIFSGLLVAGDLGRLGDYLPVRSGLYSRDTAYLEFGTVDIASGILEIYLTNDVPVSGFQIQLSNVLVTGVDGGIASELGYQLEFNAQGLILGYSYDFTTIPAGTALLCVAHFSQVNDILSPICMESAVVANEEPTYMELTLGPCWDAGGCTDPEACNYDPNAEYDDGSCLYEVDCMGICGGEAYFDDCGICSGGTSNHEHNSDMDCNNVCFGLAYENECGCVGGTTGLDPDFCFGCMDENAVNYNPEVWIDDGSCLFQGVIPAVELFFDYNVSTQQAFYFFTDAFVSGLSLTSEDWIGAFRDTVCVGARQWNGSYTDVPVNGDDGSGFTEGYLLTGEYPEFIIFDASENTYHFAYPSEDVPFAAMTQPIIESLTAADMVIFGCHDPLACNFSPDAHFHDNVCLEYDCAGVCGGMSFIDDCGECIPENSGIEPNWAMDDCGICFGNNEDMDCAGECFGSAFENECGCVGGSTGLEPDFCFGCTDQDALNYDPDAVFDDGSCLEGDYYNWMVEPTGEYQLLILNDSITALEPYDQIGVFDLAGRTNAYDCSSQAGVVLVGTGIWEEEQLEVSAIQSLDYCDFGGYQLPGFIEGNPVALRVYRESLDQEYLAELTFSAGSGNYGDMFLVVSGMSLIPVTSGCTDPEACNYDPEAEVDDGSCAYEFDCTGLCGGTAVIDDCGECTGGDTGLDFNYAMDDCGVCFGSNADMDCNGDCFGEAFIDDCGVCSGGNSGHEANSDMDCAGVCFGEAFLDDCGICSGGTSGHEGNSDQDCAGDCFGEAFIDDCGVCSGGNSGHEANSDMDCAGVCFGEAFLDDCGVCSGGTSGHEVNSDQDCAGVCFGEAFLDDCGVCSGGTSGHEANSDMDCAGVCFGGHVLDSEENCCLFEEVDCMNLCWGTAVLDPNEDCCYETDFDCAGFCFGEAYENECGCVGGDSGLEPDYCYGCTDPLALNYDPSAIFDDGSCGYDECGEQGMLTDCSGTCFNPALLSWIGDGYCDDGSFLVDLFCAGYYFDSGDCAGVPLLFADVSVTGENGWFDIGDPIFSGNGGQQLNVLVAGPYIVGDGGSIPYPAHEDMENWDVLVMISDFHDGQLEVSFESNEPIAGFQFTILSGFEEFELLSGGGGMASQQGMMISTNSSGLVLAFSLMGSSIENQEVNTCADEGLVESCTGVCVDPLILTQLGSGVCDDAPESGLNCDKWGWDGGDCIDCSGEPNGGALIDDCGECVGGSTGLEPNWAMDECGVCFGNNEDMDCAGVCFGEAFLDDCGICSGGTSGHEVNSNQDCAGVCFGTAFENECGCVGGSTGLEPDWCFGCTDPEAQNYDPDAWINDGSCLYAGNCEEQGLNTACNGLCFPDWYLYWIGDGTCDDGSFGIDLFCAQWDFDSNDCVENTLLYAEVEVAEPNGWFALTDVIVSDTDGGSYPVQVGMPLIIGDGGALPPPEPVITDDWEVFLTILDFENGTLDIGIINSGPVSAVQFQIAHGYPDFSFVAAFGGLAEQNGWMYNGSPDGFLSLFSLTGDWIESNELETCWSQVQIEDCDGNCYDPAALDNAGDDTCHDGTDLGGELGLLNFNCGKYSFDNGDCEIPEDYDCQGILNGEAFQDDCGECAGGLTGIEANWAMDCAEVCFGTAFVNECGCVGGSTGLAADFCIGCGDPQSINFDSNVSIEDGSCFYLPAPENLTAEDGEDSLLVTWQPTGIANYSENGWMCVSEVSDTAVSVTIENHINIRDFSVQMEIPDCFNPSDLSLQPGGLAQEVGLMVYLDIAEPIQILANAPADEYLPPGSGELVRLSWSAEECQDAWVTLENPIVNITEGEPVEFYVCPPLTTPFDIMYQLHRDDGVSFEDIPGNFYLDTGMGDGEFCYEVSAWVDGIESERSNSSCALDVNEPSTIPDRFGISAVWPNPFNTQLTIELASPETANAELILYDVNGRRLEVLFQGTIHAGKRKIYWDGTQYSTGIYFIRAVTGSLQDTRKVVLLK